MFPGRLSARGRSGLQSWKLPPSPLSAAEMTGLWYVQSSDDHRNVRRKAGSNKVLTRNQKSKSVRPGDVRPGHDSAVGVNFAWRTHQALVGWTASVDTKAAITLSLGGVILGFYISQGSSNHILLSAHRWQSVTEIIGMCLTVIGVIISGLVIAPRLNRRLTKKNWQQNYLYFGHLRSWDTHRLKRALTELDNDQELELLSAQLVAMARIAWYKHALLQLALASLLCGVPLVVLSTAWR